MNIKYFLIASLLFIPAASADNTNKGEALFEDKCTACHTVSLFSSDKAKITNTSDLRKRVNMCQSNVGAQWQESEIDEVTDFLSLQYKHIETTK